MELDQTIKNLIKCFPDGTIPDGTNGTIRYSDEGYFKTLWNIGEKKNGNLGNNIVIIWDGYPESDYSLVNFKSHLTPIDWVVAYSQKVKEGSEDIVISILDMYSHHALLQNMNFYTRALQYMQGWVKFYSFNKGDFPQADSPLGIKEQT